MNGGLSVLWCELFYVWMVLVFNMMMNVMMIEWKSASATTRRERDEESDARAMKRVMMVVIVGLYEKGYLIMLKCWGVGKGGMIKYVVLVMSLF